MNTYCIPVNYTKYWRWKEPESIYFNSFHFIENSLGLLTCPRSQQLVEKGLKYLSLEQSGSAAFFLAVLEIQNLYH
jgi:hypothetical protein